jgi:hypothetical protein
LHLNLSKKYGKLSSIEKEVENKIAFRIMDIDEFNKDINEEEESKAENDNYWCLPFSVDDVEEFQTETKVKGQESLVDYNYKRRGEKKWYEPQQQNQFNLFTRVIVTMNPTDNNSTILIILDEPQFEEYLFHNDTDFDICFCKYDHSNKKPLNNDFVSVLRG